MKVVLSLAELKTINLTGKLLILLKQLAAQYSPFIQVLHRDSENRVLYQDNSHTSSNAIGNFYS